MNENINILKGMGLTMYEAQAYVTLTSLISSNATEISEKSGIPRSKIYDVLKGLVKKNFIDVEDGRPLTYNVKSPVEVLSREKERLDTEIDDTITSPTFCLISEYHGKMPLYHMDVYRLEGADDFINLGTDDMIYGDGICIIEWSEKIMDELPSKTITLKITPQDDGSRLIEIDNWQNGEIK